MLPEIKSQIPRRRSTPNSPDVDDDACSGVRRESEGQCGIRSGRAQWIGSRCPRGRRSPSGARPTAANQLIAEGIELAMKALMLARGSTPPAHHSLRALCSVLDDTDKVFVDETVRNAIDQSATGPVPFGLPNVVSAAVRGSAPLGEVDPIAGYADMDAAAFFALLDATWGAESSQYLGPIGSSSSERSCAPTPGSWRAGSWCAWDSQSHSRTAPTARRRRRGIHGP